VTTGGAAAVLPERLGRYEVRALLGRGAMGSVYKALDPALDREVAVKTLGGFLLEAPEHREEYLERFQREARAAARLSHPNIVAVYDVGVDEATGSPFIVMEYVPGVTLATLLRENPALPVGQAVEIADQVAAALEEAHRHGIVHRDVKPGNVFLDARGRVKVGDFGIARMDGSDLTQAGVLLGTPGYLAPEVVRGAPADARADVFALGALTYALLFRPRAGLPGSRASHSSAAGAGHAAAHAGRAAGRAGAAGGAGAAGRGLDARKGARPRPRQGKEEEVTC
jgi:eukaryotic-like serine/threonine-protein kinase